MSTSIFGRVSIQSASYKKDHMHKSLLIGILYIYIEMLCTYIDAMKTFYFKVMNFQKFLKLLVYVDFFYIF